MGELSDLALVNRDGGDATIFLKLRCTHFHPLQLNQVKYQITETENSHHKQPELPRRERQDMQSQELNALLFRENIHTFPRRTLSL